MKNLSLSLIIFVCLITWFIWHDYHLMKLRYVIFFYYWVDSIMLVMRAQIWVVMYNICCTESHFKNKFECVYVFKCRWICATMHMCRSNNILILYILCFSHWLAWEHPGILSSCHRRPGVSDAHYCPRLCENYVD